MRDSLVLLGEVGVGFGAPVITMKRKKKKLHRQ